MKTLVVADIHSCFDELMELIFKAGIGDEDQIWALGDLVDRGPDPVGVLDLFYINDNFFSIRGNHEEKHRLFIRDGIRFSQSQGITREQIGQKYSVKCSVFEQFPLYKGLEEANLVHGFVEPGKPLNEQQDKVLLGRLSATKYLESRFKEKWYELYDGDKPVIVGHLDYHGDNKPFVYKDKMFGIETRCFAGGGLTGILLPDFKIITVPSRSPNHWEDVKRQYPKVKV